MRISRGTGARAAVSRRTAVLLCFAGLALAGCGAGDRGGAITLRFWAMGREGEVVPELMADFERENPGVRVQVQQVPWSAAHEKLLTSYVGNVTPDVSQLGNTWVSEFAALNALEPVSKSGGAAGGAPIDSVGFFPGIWETNVIDGVAYGVPWYVDTRVLYYRRDLLAAAGYPSMPTTWAEWRNAMVAVKKVAGPGKFAIFLPLNEWPHLAILGLQAGSPLLKDNDTAGDFQSPQFRRALAFYLDLFKSELAPSVTNNEIANLYQEFGKGYFSMYISGPWNLGEFKRRLPPEQQSSWATAPLPGPDSTTAGVSLAGGSSLVVYAGSPHKEAAWKLVRYLSRPEVQLRFYHATGDLPAREEAWGDTSLVGDPNMRTFGQQLKHVVPTPKVPEWELIATRLQERSELVVRGAATPDSVLAQLDRDVARILEKRRWMLAKRGVLPHAAAAVNP